MEENQREQTRSVLVDLDVAAFMNQNRCHLKRKSDPGFAYITLDDALNYNYVVHFLDSEGQKAYATLDEMLDDGWILD